MNKNAVYSPSAFNINSFNNVSFNFGIRVVSTGNNNPWKYPEEEEADLSLFMLTIMVTEEAL